MRLFQVTYLNHLHDIAKRRLSCPEDAVDDLYELEQAAGFELPLASLQVLIEKAPSPIKAILTLLGTAKGRTRLKTPYRWHRDGSRETSNERLCRLTGAYDPKRTRATQILHST